jgi:hypothetical protein
MRHLEADIDVDPILKKSRSVRIRLAFLPEGRKWSSADVSPLIIIFYFLDKYKRSIRKHSESQKVGKNSWEKNLL